MSKIETLAHLLEEASLAYYAGQPLMSDDEYDALYEQLVSVQPDHPFLTKVGALSADGIWPEVKHESVMGSLLKIKTDDELRSWAQKYTSGDLVWSEKLDGVSIKLTYENGFFKRAVTRGNGLVGQDISPNVFIMQGFPKRISIKEPVHVRGEILLLNSVWREHFQGEKNARNSAAGTARRKYGSDKCRHLQIFSYDVSIPLTSKTEVFAFSKQEGFQVANFGYGSISDIAAIHQKYAGSVRQSLDYDIDGLVVEENNLENAKRLGMVDNRPRAARAFKFVSQGAFTVLEGIAWQVGRTGVVTPVGLVKPVDIGGVTISNVTLCNMDFISTMGIGIGSQLKVVRSNDVIPKVVTCLTTGSTVQKPTHCPECEAPLVERVIKKSKAGLTQPACENPDCSGRSLKGFMHFLRVFEVKGLGDVLVERLIEEGLLQSIPDLFKLNPTEIGQLDGMSEKLAFKYVGDLMRKTKEATLSKFIASLGIRGFGEGLAEIVAAEIPTLDGVRGATEEELGAINRIGPEFARYAVDGLREKAGLIDVLLSHIKIVEPKGPTGNKLVGVSFCFTGFRDKELQTAIENEGGKVVSGVSSKTTYLVTAEEDSTSTKAQKAKQLGVKILSREDCFRIAITLL